MCDEVYFLGIKLTGTRIKDLRDEAQVPKADSALTMPA